MAICVLCEKEVEPGDKVTQLIDGKFYDFCSMKHFRDYENGERSLKKAPPEPHPDARPPSPPRKRRQAAKKAGAEEE